MTGVVSGGRSWANIGSCGGASVWVATQIGTVAGPGKFGLDGFVALVERGFVFAL